jgi:hypothetical protein
MKTVIVIASLLAALPAGAAMYKWVDPQGRVQYTDTPPPANAKNVEEPKITRSTIQSTGSPYAVQDAARRNPVTLWTSDCGPLCTQAREFLAKRGVPHSVRNPSRQTEQNDWKKASGGANEVPLLIIGSLKTLKGFDEAEWNSALDAAGYPRSAPSIKPQAVPTDPQQPAQAQAPQPGATPAAPAAPQQGAAQPAR